jgi:DNA ligase (NAD+)
MKPKDPIEVLADEIHRHNVLYWVKHKPEIGDEEYDKLVKRLEQLAPFHPVLSEMIEDDGKTKKIKHDVPMLSLSKVFTADEVAKWAVGCGAFEKSFKVGGGLVASFKVDGSSCSILYRKGKLVRAATRGQHGEGDDITANLLTIPGIPTTLEPTKYEKLDGDIEIRGEVYMSNASFEAYDRAFTALVAAGKEKEDDRSPNPRNLCAGSLKNKDPEVTRSRKLSFMAHNSVGLGGTEQQNYWTMKKWGFETPYANVVEDAAGVAAVIAEIDVDRRKLPYATDGIVFGINDTSKHDELGCTGHHPKYRLAFKFARENATTELLDIHWETSRHGKLAPRAELKPVDVGGANVSWTTLFNAKFVADADLRIGDEVKIEREVIPYFLGKTADKGGKPVALPTTCTSCGHAVVWEEPNDKGVSSDLICPNFASCPAQLENYLNHYVSRTCTNMLGVGDEVISRLVASGKLKGPADLFRLTEADVGNNGKNIVASIQGRKTQPLATFLISLGIHLLGRDKSPKIAEKFETLDAVLAASKNDFLAIEKVGDGVATAVYEGLKERRQIIDDLLKVVTVEKCIKVVGLLTGKSFCCSGTVEFDWDGRHYDSRPDIQDLIKELGGEAKGSVGSKITALIHGDGAGAKVTEAKSKGVKMMTGAEFQAYLESLK